MMYFHALTVLAFFAVLSFSMGTSKDDRIDHTELLASLLANHDSRIRPNVHGPPVTVLCGLYIRSFDSISETTMMRFLHTASMRGKDYTITTYFRQQWNDPRLKFNASGFINMNGDIVNALWVPDLYFENAKETDIHSTTKDNLFLRVYPNGDVYYSVRLGLILTCNMHLERFPMDQQRCKIEVETYSYTTDNMKLQWFDSNPIQIDSEVVLPQYKIVSLEYFEITRPYTTGNYSHLISKIILQRELGFYMLQAYIPSILLVILSWISLWMEPSAAPARVGLGITTVLALVTQSTWMRSQLPKVAYATALDIWMVTCQVFVFAALVEFAIVYYLNTLQKLQNDTGNINKQKKRHASSNGAFKGVRYTAPHSPKCSQWITRSSSLGNMAPDCTSHGLTLRRPGNTSYDIESDGKAFTNQSEQGVHKINKRYGQMAAKSDRYSRVLFPIAFLIFSGLYWYQFLKNPPEYH